MASGGNKSEETPLKNVGISAALAEEMDRFIAQNPELGIKFRNEFANRACAHYLDLLCQRVIRRLTMDALKEGKPDHLRELRQHGLKPEHEV